MLPDESLARLRGRVSFTRADEKERGTLSAWRRVVSPGVSDYCLTVLINDRAHVLAF